MTEPTEKPTVAERRTAEAAANEAADRARDEARAFSAEQMREQRIMTGDAIPDVGGDVQVFDPAKPHNEMWRKAEADEARAHFASVDPKLEGRPE